MVTVRLALLASFALWAVAGAFPCPEKVQGSCEAQEKYFQTQVVDHFSWKSPQTWSQRNFISETYFDKANGPIFLYGECQITECTKKECSAACIAQARLCLKVA